MAKQKSRRYVYPVTLGQVRLKVGPLTWSLLSKDLKQKLVHGTENIEKIRELISNSAKVQSMPPVEVVGELWRINEVMINGCCTLIKIDGQFYFGVQFPANTVTIDNRFLLRSVMLHEFSHCFYEQMKVIKAITEGKSGFSDYYDNENPEEDEARMIKPEEWFGPDDTKIIRQYDERLRQFENTFLEFLGQLPVVSMAQANFHCKKLAIPSDVEERIKQLIAEISDPLSESNAK